VDLIRLRFSGEMSIHVLTIAPLLGQTDRINVGSISQKSAGQIGEQNLKKLEIQMAATKAATRAGYSEKTSAEQGARLLINVKVAEAIAEAQSGRTKPYKTYGRRSDEIGTQRGTYGNNGEQVRTSLVHKQVRTVRLG
jgi:hypothetical protein